MPALSITNAKGRLVNLLNEDPSKKSTENKKRRYQCTESGCQKSFTTRYEMENKILIRQ